MNDGVGTTSTGAVGHRDQVPLDQERAGPFELLAVDVEQLARIGRVVPQLLDDLAPRAAGPSSLASSASAAVVSSCRWRP